jgi:hypothetical protein
MALTLAVPANPCNIHPVYSLVAVEGPVRVMKTGSKYEASTTISFRVHEVTGAVIVSVEAGLLEHVRGHQIIANRVAHSGNGRIEAEAASEAQARSQLRDGIRKLTVEQNGELSREERAYDNVTENGASQSQGPSYGFPGGPDVQDPACTR